MRVTHCKIRGQVECKILSWFLFINRILNRAVWPNVNIAWAQQGLKIRCVSKSVKVVDGGSLLRFFLSLAWVNALFCSNFLTFESLTFGNNGTKAVVCDHFCLSTKLLFDIGARFRPSVVCSLAQPNLVNVVWIAVHHFSREILLIWVYNYEIVPDLDLAANIRAGTDILAHCAEQTYSFSFIRLKLWVISKRRFPWFKFAWVRIRFLRLMLAIRHFLVFL